MGSSAEVAAPHLVVRFGEFGPSLSRASLISGKPITGTPSLVIPRAAGCRRHGSNRHDPRHQAPDLVAAGVEASAIIGTRIRGTTRRSRRLVSVERALERERTAAGVGFDGAGQETEDLQ